MSTDRGRAGRQMSRVLVGFVVAAGLVIAACSDAGPDTGAVPDDDAGPDTGAVPDDDAGPDTGAVPDDDAGPDTGAVPDDDAGPDTGAVPDDDAPLPVISAYGSYVIDLDNREVVELPRSDYMRVSVSPDRTRIAYSTDSGLFLMDSSGQNSVQVADSRTRVRWSPDSKWFTYFGDEGLYSALVNSTGTSRSQLASDSSAPTLVAWSPDSKRLAYGNDEMLSEEVRFTSASPSWSPDSVHLAYGIGSGAAGADRRIVIADVESGAQTRIDHGLVSTLWFWSPDGAHIAYKDKVGLSVANASGGDRRPIATLYWAHPFWSPDGSRVAFNDEDGMVVTDSDGRNRTQVSPMHFEAIGWSLDSTKIAYSDRYGSGLFVANADGGNHTKLADAITSYESSIGWMADGNTIIYTVRSPGE